MDLTIDTFIPEFVIDGKFNGLPLEHGCILERAYENGRPGVSGEYSPESRMGNANHAKIFVRQIDSAMAKQPKRGDVIEADGEEWTLRIIRKSAGGVWEFICEQKGTRATLYERGTTSKSPSRVRG